MFFSVPKLQFASDHLFYKNQYWYYHEIEAVKHGMLDQYVNGIPVLRKYYVSLKHRNQKKINIRYMGAISNKETNKKLICYRLLIDSLYKNIAQPMAMKALSQIIYQGSYTLGPCKVLKNGLELTKRGLFSKKVFFVPWNECLKADERGDLVLWNKNNKRIKTRIPILSTWNAPVLWALLHYLWDGKCFQLERGELKVP